MSNSTTAYEQLKAMGEACIDNTPQQVESLCGVTESEYDKGMRDCVKTIASQIGLSFGVDVGYADLPYKLATYFSDLRAGNAVDGEWKNGDVCVVRGHTYTFECVASWDKEACILAGKSKGSESFTDAWISELSKPESPQEKAKRERKEYSKQIFLAMGYHDNPNEANSIQVEEAISSCYELYDAGYRKGE